jgi:VCBS repeat-containing protein
MARRSRRPSVAFVLSASLVVLLPTAALAAPAADAPAKGGPAHYIVTYDERPGRAERHDIEAMGGKVRRNLPLVDGLAVELPPGQLRQLQRAAGVETVEIDAPLAMFDHATATGDLEYENAWGVEHIGTREVHQAGNTGQGIKLAIIDTGIDYVHDDPDNQPYVVDPEFAGNYAGGYDFFNNDLDPMDDNGHGTHVAGIAAAEKNGYLVVGVAPDVELYALKVLGAQGNGEYSGLIAALGWAITHDMDVVNMSLGGHEVSAALQTAIASAYDAGITLVAASGNVNPGSIQELLYGCQVAYPAAYSQVIAVSFTGQNDRLTGYSCTGPQVDLAAPGDQIFSPVPAGPVGSCMFCTPQGYSAQSGTSMASPHVAGVASLMLRAGIDDADDDGFVADDLKAHLCANTMPAQGMATTDSRYPNWYGCGIVDADKALIDNPPPGSSGPEAAADAATVAEDATVDVDVLVNDSDPDGLALTVTAVSDPLHGTAAIDLDGSVGYAADPDYHGLDTFEYTIQNTDGDDATGTVTITVTPVNDEPVAVDDVLVTTLATPGTVAVLANDSDVDGDGLTTTAVGTAAHGSTSLGLDGSITYTPAGGYVGSDTFTYTIEDGVGGSASATVQVSVVSTNAPPVAVDDSATTTEDTPVTIDVLANDSDPDGGALTVTIVGSPGQGDAAIDASGDIVYSPDADSSGADSFDYTVADSIGATDTATVQVTVEAGNDPPVAADDSATTAEDTVVLIDVLANDADPDGDGLSVSSVGTPTAGSATIEPDGRIRYEPLADVTGTDAFGYTLSDGDGATDTATVTVTISPANDIPMASNKTASTAYGAPVTITLSGADVETCDLTFQVVTAPAHGSVGAPQAVLCTTLLPPYSDSAKITYTPAAGYWGADSFTYRVSDGSAWSAPATVAITIQTPALVHMGDLDPSRTLQGGTWTAIVTVVMHNANDTIVKDVTMTGVWSNGATGSASCKGNHNGLCQVKKTGIPSTTTSVMFTVTGMSAPGKAYDAGANHDSDGNSTGTAVTVRR